MLYYTRAELCCKVETLRIIKPSWRIISPPAPLAVKHLIISTRSWLHQGVVGWHQILQAWNVQIDLQG